VSLLLVCRCGAEHELQPGGGALCAPCRADEECVAERAELVRLWRKRGRYAASGASLAGVERQAARTRARIEARCVAIDPARAAELASRQGDLALAVAKTPSRLVVARG